MASCKKVDEPTPSKKQKEKAKPVIPTREGVSVSEAHPELHVEDFSERKPKPRKAKPSEAERLEDAKVTVVRVEEIIKKQKLKMAKEVEDIMELMNAREFGAGESPLRELAQIGYVSQITLFVFYM